MTRFLYLQGTIFFCAGQTEKRLWALILVAVMMLFLVYGLTDTPYFKNDLALSFWLVLALGCSLMSRESHRSSCGGKVD